MPTVSDRLSYEKWATEGRTENDTAREQVEVILAAHHDQEPYLRDEQLAELAAVCAADDDDLAWARHA